LGHDPGDPWVSFRSQPSVRRATTRSARMSANVSGLR
jgi:hypothetical protein